MKLNIALHLVPMLYMYVGKLRSVVARNRNVDSDTSSSYATVNATTEIQNRSQGSQQPRTPLLQK